MGLDFNEITAAANLGKEIGTHFALRHLQERLGNLAQQANSGFITVNGQKLDVTTPAGQQAMRSAEISAYTEAGAMAPQNFGTGQDAMYHTMGVAAGQAASNETQRGALQIAAPGATPTQIAGGQQDVGVGAALGGNLAGAQQAAMQAQTTRNINSPSFDSTLPGGTPNPAAPGAALASASQKYGNVGALSQATQSYLHGTAQALAHLSGRALQQMNSGQMGAATATLISMHGINDALPNVVNDTNKQNQGIGATVQMPDGSHSVVSWANVRAMLSKASQDPSLFANYAIQQHAASAAGGAGLTSTILKGAVTAINKNAPSGSMGGSSQIFRLLTTSRTVKGKRVSAAFTAIGKDQPIGAIDKNNMKTNPTGDMVKVQYRDAQGRARIGLLVTRYGGLDAHGNRQQPTVTLTDSSTGQPVTDVTVVTPGIRGATARKAVLSVADIVQTMYANQLSLNTNALQQRTAERLGLLGSLYKSSSTAANPVATNVFGDAIGSLPAATIADTKAALREHLGTTPDTATVHAVAIQRVLAKARKDFGRLSENKRVVATLFAGIAGNKIALAWAKGKTFMLNGKLVRPHGPFDQSVLTPQLRTQLNSALQHVTQQRAQVISTSVPSAALQAPGLSTSSPFANVPPPPPNTSH